MSRLTREEMIGRTISSIEIFFNARKANKREGPYRKATKEERRPMLESALSHFATQIQSLSQEAVRDEALENVLGIAGMLEFQAKLVLNNGESDIKLDAATIVPKIVESLRALKREPNAAARDGLAILAALPQEMQTLAESLAGPAPAAPDVTEAIRCIEACAKYMDERDESPRCAVDLRKAAALLARLGQGWIPVSERLPTRAKEIGTWSDPVLCLFDSGAMSVELCIRYSSGKISWNLAPGVTAQVTHWMPLPLPPGASDD